MGRVRKPRAAVEATAETVETLNGGLSHGPSKFRDDAEPIEDLMPGFAAFPEEEAEPRHPELDPSLVMRRPTNDERIARQRAAFSDPPAELAAAVVVAPAPAAQTPRRPAPRRVSAEVVKAETALINLDRRREDSLAHAEAVWASKRVALIQSFPADVLAALEAMNVLAADEEEP